MEFFILQTTPLPADPPLPSELDIAITLGMMLLAILVYQGARFILNKKEKSKFSGMVSRMVVLWTVGIAGFFSVILLSPIPVEIKVKMLEILGIILSAAIALSSTSFLGNAFAGFMIKSIKNFQVGDFIKVNEMNGRVSDMGFFHVEIVTNNMDLVTLPNLFLITNPVTVSKFAKRPKRKDDKEGKIITSVVSLGYDVPRDKVESTLLRAAKHVGLEDPFVFITELGDFSVVYKVHGLLKDKDKVMVTPSLLNGAVLDYLHNAKIEIVSPNFMNQRPIGDQPVTSRATRPPVLMESFNPQEIVFNKAIQAESIEGKKKRYDAAQKRIGALKEALKSLDDEQEINNTQSRIDSLEGFCEKLTEAIKSESEDLKLQQQ